MVEHSFTTTYFPQLEEILVDKTFKTISGKTLQLQVNLAQQSSGNNSASGESLIHKSKFRQFTNDPQ